MLDAAILQQYEDFMDGQSTISQALEIQLANNAKNKLETELRLEITKKLDTSLTTVAGGTYTTGYKLQTDFLMPDQTIYVGTEPFKQIPMAVRELYKGSTGFFYIDSRTGFLYLTGTPQAGQVISIPYFFATSDMTSLSVNGSVSPPISPAATITWPDRFHSLISMEMAQMYYPIDAGDKNRAWDDRWMAAYKDLKASFVVWDQQLKLASISNQTPYGEIFPPRSEDRINTM